MGVPHGIFNKSDQTAKTLFWVSPTQKLYDLFWGLHNMKEQKPEDVVAMAAEFNIHFLPPPPGNQRRFFRLARHHARGKPRSCCVAAHDRLACFVVQDGVDIGEALRRELLDRVDHAFRPPRRFDATMSAVIGNRFCS